jgi:hypothetical protein
MGCYKDLPKDVKWLICRALVILEWSGKKPRSFHFNPFAWEEKRGILNRFCKWKNHSHPSQIMKKLATLNRASLELIRSKCFRYKDGWFFINGALTSN